jgi:hypothetical protein
MRITKDGEWFFFFFSMRNIILYSIWNKDKKMPKIQLGISKGEE